MVAYGEARLRVRGVQRDGDRTALGGVLDRVADEVLEYLLDTVAVGDHRGGAIDLDADVVGLAQQLHPLADFTDDLGEVDLRQTELDPSLLEPRDVEQLVDESCELLRLAIGHRQRVDGACRLRLEGVRRLARFGQLGHAPSGDLQEAAHRGERRAQLV